MSNFSLNSFHCLICAKSSSHHPHLLAQINGKTVWGIASLNDHSILLKMDNISEGNTSEGNTNEDNTSKGNTSESKASDEKTIREQILFDLGECVKEFEELRWNRDRTKEVLSPCLTGISTSPSFHKLIYLCSIHDPAILKSVLRDALDECTEAEKKMNEEKKSKKREAEIRLGSESRKKAKVEHLGNATTTISQQSQATPNSPSVSEVRLQLNALKFGVTANPDSQMIRQASEIQRELPGMAQASASSRFQSPEDVYETGPVLSPALHLARSSKNIVPGCDTMSRAEDTQSRTGSEYGLDSEEDMENKSDIHREDSTVQDTSAATESHDLNLTIENTSMLPDNTSNESEMFVPNHIVDANQSMKATLEPSSMPSPLRSSVTASPPSQETTLTNNPIKTKTPTTYEIELGLVRGEGKIKEFVMKECFPLGDDYRANNKRFSKADDLRELFPIFRKFYFRIVKDRLLRELKSRIEVPGQKTAIPSTAELVNPSEILDALQSIKMTTINAKVNRAYGQMRLYKSVQGKIEKGGYVPDNSLTHGVAAHTSLLAKMACCSAGNVSAQERRDRINSFNYEYAAGRKWLEVAEWFGGEGIVLIFATAGVWNQNLFFCVLV